MHEFKYVNNRLYCEKVKVEELARKYGTPLYVYSYHTLLSHFLKLQDAFKSISPLICYSVKANSNLAILKALVDKGAGLDIVSGGELHRALQVGCPAGKIVYASVGKTDKEIAKELFISIGTAKKHREHLIHKTGAKNTAGLVAQTMNNGL